MSKEESFSSSAILAQTAALGAQAAQTTLTPASNSVRPEIKEADDSKPKGDGELTAAPLEDDVLYGDSEGGTGDDQR